MKEDTDPKVFMDSGVENLNAWTSTILFAPRSDDASGMEPPRHRPWKI
ncbi:MAG: hypothetical protein ACK553_06920 [Planctomycetota bacterium]|jgi:hypothetical protein